MKLWLKLKLRLMSRRKRISYMRTLPIEIRYQLRHSGFPYNWRFFSCYYKNLWHLIDSTKYFFSESQRADRDSWSLDISTSLWILPRLRILREFKHGVPCWAFEEPEKIHHTAEEFEQAQNTFNAALDDIIYAFEYHLINEIRHFGCWRAPQECTDRRDKGFEYFGKYFSSLWD